MDKKDTANKIVTGSKEALDKVSGKLSEGVFDALGRKKNIKELSMNQRIGYGFLAFVFLFLAIAVIVVALSYVIDKNFKETYYQVGCGKVNGNIRIIHLSDLHDSQYGKNNSRLLKRIKELKPDLIVMTGDMTDHRSLSRKATMAFFAETPKIAPTYFIYGNNEWTWDFKGKRKKDELLSKSLVDCGLHLLQDKQETLTVGENTIDIYGILHSDPKNFWAQAGNSFADAVWKNEENFKLTLIHEPYLLQAKPGEKWGDLVLAGHTHGGVVVLPKLGPIYERESGVLPVLRKVKCFMGGVYHESYSTIIVSTGLTNKGPVRINNRPELVIIDVNRY